jgi:hypothetical protein
MTSETEEGQRLAEGKLKRITQGMGKIKAVRKYENPIEFAETHKLCMDANHKPVVRGSDNAIWNRLHPVPFSITIPPDEIDRSCPPNCSRKLRASWHGRWSARSVDGVRALVSRRRWRARGRCGALNPTRCSSSWKTAAWCIRAFP